MYGADIGFSGDFGPVTQAGSALLLLGCTQPMVALDAACVLANATGGAALRAAPGCAAAAAAVMLYGQRAAPAGLHPAHGRSGRSPHGAISSCRRHVQRWQLGALPWQLHGSFWQLRVAPVWVPPWH